MLRPHILELEFLIRAVQEKQFSINQHKISFDPSREFGDEFDISKQSKRLDKLKKILQLFDIININSDLNIKDLTQSNYNDIDILINAFIKKQSIYNLPKGLEALKLKISNITILLFLIHDTNFPTKYEIKDFFNSGIDFYCKDENDNYLQVPSFSYLSKSDYLEISNIDYNKILNSYKELSYINNTIYKIANNDMLQILSAYDESKSHNTVLLESAKSIALWILNEDTDSLPQEIKMLNYLQIIKRERDLDNEEKDKLIEISETQNISIAIKVAANILLENKRIFLFYFDKMSKNEKVSFKEFPIYNLRPQ